MKAFAHSDISQLQLEIDSLSEKRKEAQDKVLQRGASMCSNVGWYKQLPTQVEVNQAHVIEMELGALAASAKGNDEEAERLLREATTLEESTSFMFGPPTIAKPSHELYADWLLSKGRAADAQIQYEKALERAPGRMLSERGLERSKTNKL